MPVDTLVVFGNEYDNVAGIKAYDDNGQLKTYIRPQGTKSISANGTGIDVTAYAAVDVAVPSQTPTLQSKTKTYTPTESQQTETVTADSGYDGLSGVSVTVNAVSSSYVGSSISRRSSSDLTASGATVTAPAGYYESAATKAVASGTEGTPSATKGTVSNNSISVTPSVTNVAGYISGGTKTGTAVTVSASELVSGTKTITENGTGIDVTNYGNVDVTVPSGGLTTVTILPAQSITATTTHSNGSYSVYLDNISENLIAGTSYLVTIDGDAYICHADTAWDSVYAGDVEVIWGDPSNALYPFMLGSYANNRTEFGYGDNSTHTLKIERVVSFSAPELISKSITTNGTYDPADDDADGYSEVIVSVSGGTTWETLHDGSLWIYSSSPNYVLFNNYTTPFASGETYRVTWGSDTFIYETASDGGFSYDGYFIGNPGVVGETDDGSGATFFIYRDRSDRAVAATTDASGNKYIKIERQVSGGNYQAKTNISPTTSSQTIYPDTGYDALSSVQINAMPSGTAGTPTATKGTVSNHAISVTPSVTNSAGYVPSETKTGTAVTVSASELVSGSETKTENGTYDVTNLASLVVNVPTGGSSNFTLLGTQAVGTVSTSSTSASDTGVTITVKGVYAYDLLVCECSVNTKTAGRHAATTRLCWLTASSNISTKNGATFATATWNCKLSSNSTPTASSSTTAYGVYANGCTVSAGSTGDNGQAVITIYRRYNSTATGTINGSYTMRVYGVKIYDLIGG